MILFDMHFCLYNYFVLFSNFGGICRGGRREVQTVNCGIFLYLHLSCNNSSYGYLPFFKCSRFVALQNYILYIRKENICVHVIISKEEDDEVEPGGGPINNKNHRE